jgi:hypothetical protein
MNGISDLPTVAAQLSFTAPAVLDIEASGFGQDSYPIEIGFVLPDGQSYCSLIKPAAGWTHWDAAAEKLHHISRKTVQTHGRDAREVARLLNEQLRGMTLYCDGWAHDYVWLNVLFEAVEMTPFFKLDNLRVLLTEREADFFDIVKRQVASELRLQRHRASSDAKILQHTMIRLRGALPSPGSAPAPSPAASA